jgi:hypothetical protein
MALDKFERANLNRLLKCVTPNQNRIDRIKKKVREDAEKAFATIEELKRQNEGFQELIDELRAKENAPEEDPIDLEPIEVEEEVEDKGEEEEWGVSQEDDSEDLNDAFLAEDTAEEEEEDNPFNI